MSPSLPKKTLGQHWLHDQSVLAAIANAAEIGPKDTVLEIGPGLGTLTLELVTRAAHVVAVELDKDLAKELSGTIKAQNLEVIEEDILKFDVTALPVGYKVVANIPYYLTSNLLRVLSESANPPAMMVLLVQKEVAQRIVAKPGQMSLLSSSVQFYYQASLGQVVPAKLFTPPPKVDSQALQLIRHAAPLFPDVDIKLFFRLVKAGFSNRRKTLLNSLSAGLRLPKEETKKMLTKAGLNPQGRAQELSLNDWHKLYEGLE